VRLINTHEQEVDLSIKLSDIWSLIFAIQADFNGSKAHYKQHSFELFLDQEITLIQLHKDFCQLHCRIDIHESFMESYKADIEKEIKPL